MNFSHTAPFEKLPICRHKFSFLREKFTHFLLARSLFSVQSDHALPHYNPMIMKLESIEEILCEVKRRLLHPTPESLKDSLLDLQKQPFIGKFPSVYSFHKPLFLEGKLISEPKQTHIRIDEELCEQVLKVIRKRFKKRDKVMMNEPLHSILMDAWMVQHQLNRDS